MMFDIESLIQFREAQIINLSGGYNHVAIIFEKNKYDQPLCYGTNYLVDIYDNRSIHAEHDALIRLKKNYSSKLKKINFLVIRYTKTYQLTTSKPCIFCLEKMKVIAFQKGYMIHKVYYSGFREIYSDKFTTLYNQDNKHIPNRNRRKNYSGKRKLIVME
jgi:deoxycytidylate deaminase